MNSMQSYQYYIGLMSGTSMDGIDAVLAKLTNTQWQGVCAHAFIPYPENLKRKLLALQTPAHNELAQAAVLAQELAHLNAQAVSAVLTEADIEVQAITALGCHGQTIRHAPEQHYSIQLMDWALLAELTGITTVGDFRSRDLAAGGQGAPLVPAFHQAVFASEQHSRVVLNLGGIANISVLQPQQPAFGFDTGPANMLMDAWVQHHWQQEFDYNGTLASQGQIIEPLLQAMLGHDYFSQPYPKSTGRDLFSLDWLNQYLTGQEKPADVLRTLLELTAQTAVNAIINTAPDTNNVYVCGGGSQNRLLMHTLAQLLEQHQISLHSTDNLQIPAQLVEAAAFAWLAACWYQHQPVPTYHATGAVGARILGCGYWA
ncbi:anhydro-N-acetylmuramic acid kinase [Snodgrassella alvi]